MRDEDRKRIYGVYTSLGMEIPHKKINDLISISYSAVDKVGDEFFYYDRITGIEEHMEILIANMEKRSMDTIEKYGTGNKFEDVYRFCTKQVPNIHKSMIQRTYDIMSVNKKIAYLCVAQTKRALSRTTKINPSLKSRKINKELTFINKRFDKERKEQSRKAEREALEIKKQEEENKEVLRQRKKFEYLLSQTELFSQFMLGKKNIDHFDSNKEKDDELASLSKKFKEAAIKQKESKFNDQGEIEGKEPSNTTSNFIPQPKILNCELKNYQINGFNWLVKLYDKGINGILADDMGLGKTVQSISLLAYLGETEDNWGPFLIVTPASTLHNWEQEIKKFVPVFKILNYWGNSTLRAQMRNEIKSVNIVLTSYQIAVADYKILRKTKWMYMILDEAQAIKSSASKRWTTLLSFKTRNRLLLTGTPVQNTMSELWALLHFIMPTLFDSLSEFTEWFSKGIEESAERKKAVDEIQLQKLHAILKPFMLRRLKSDVKTELGIKKEMELFCELSPRQKIYYQSIVDACRSYEMENIIMQLRKVCNHPDLFEKLETTTKISLFKNEEEGQSVEMGRSKISIKLPSLIVNDAINTFEEKLAQRKKILNFLKIRCWEYINENNKCLNSQDVFAWIRFMWNNSLDYEYGNDFISGLSSLKEVLKTKKNVEHHRSYIEREMEGLIDKKIYDYSLLNPCTKNIVSTFPYVYSNETECPLFLDIKSEDKKLIDLTINDIVYIPPLNTFIIDSGKLKLLDSLLPNLKAEGHRILIYFQMTKMMDLVEDYLVKKEYSYCRLDGSSKISVRRDTVNDWQTGDKFIFLLSTRAGGLGINLTAADTVIFFDSDWNPTVDQQAMDRAYRIGQTKDVTVYRLITKNTIEERVMEKANKKGDLQKMVIKGKIFEGYEF